jgi:protein LSM14
MNNAPATGAHGNVPVTDATSAAAAAVAAAMAKLPQPGAQKKPGQPDPSVDAMTRKMNDMRPYDNTRGRGGHQHRGGRGGARPQHKKIDVPQSDYDFETANAKFNKQDLVKEAIATGSPAAEAEAHSHDGEPDLGNDVGANGATTSNLYNRGSSFFDNISSEARDREENAATRLGGREWRGEEEKRNIETFGQGSVDGNRGRGRGRGRGYGRGRGGYGRGRGYGYGPGGRGGSRGGRAPSSQSTGVPSLG